MWTTNYLVVLRKFSDKGELVSNILRSRQNEQSSNVDKSRSGKLDSSHAIHGAGWVGSQYLF